MNRIRAALFAFVKAYWRVLRPTVLGSRLIVVRDDQVLLVRLSYTRGWSLPGGGVKRGESFAAAARRELAEECGLEATAMRLFHVYFGRVHGKIDHVAIFVVDAFNEIRNALRDPEIHEMRFFPLSHLPADTGAATRRRLREFAEHVCPADEW